MHHSLIVIIWSLFVSFHDFHVTHTTIYYNADKEAIEITVNVAIEDLERSLEDKTAKKMILEANKAGADAIKLQYIKPENLI